MAEIKIGGNSTIIPFALVGYEVIITNSRYALVSYFITSYPTRGHGIIAIDYQLYIFFSNMSTCRLNFLTFIIYVFHGSIISFSCIFNPLGVQCFLDQNEI